MPSILVETAFISNREESGCLPTASYQEHLAESIVPGSTGLHQGNQPRRLSPAPSRFIGMKNSMHHSFFRGGGARAMTYENILFQVQEGIATITFNRPKALNALNQALLAELSRGAGRHRRG